MKQERILSYNMSKKLTEEDLSHISAGSTTLISGSKPHNQQGIEHNLDIIVDI